MNTRSFRRSIILRPNISKSKEKPRKDLKIEDPFAINERIFSLTGVWPLKKAPLRFFLTAVYFTIHVVCGFVDLVEVSNNLYLLVANLLEALIAISVLCLIIMIQFNSILPQTLYDVRADVASLNFTSYEEMLMYFAYNYGSRLFGKIIFYNAFTASLIFYISPALELLIEGKSNSSEPYVLPYRSKVFLDYSDFKWYVLLYVYRMPILLLGVTHASTTSMLVNVALHLCGKVAILSHRIRNITATTKEQFNYVIANLVQMHVSLVQMCKTVNDSLHLILLLVLGDSCLRLSLCMYTISTSTEVNALQNMIGFVIYVITMLTLLFAYCYVGEQLVQECKNMQEAFYYCNWQELPSGCRKSLLICMNYSQKYLTITAGRFYTLSLYGFTGIMKTALAYVSMLRTFS